MMPKTLITIGLIIVAIGLVWFLAERLGLGHLPGDIIIKRDWGTIYIPITTSIVVSLVLSVCFWTLSKFSP
jgi:DUF2905 family protein